MRKMLLLFLLLCSLAAESLCSQVNIKPTYLSVSNKYEFTLPQFAVSLPLPAHAQFMVPHLSGKNIELDINDVTCYYFDLSYLKTPGTFTFKFKLPSSTKNDDILTMIILNIDESEAKRRFGDVISKGKGDAIAGLKTKLGKSISYIASAQGDHKVESHAVPNGEYTYLFILKTEMDKKLKKQYLRLIKGFKEKQQPYLKVRYENKVQNAEVAVIEKEETTAPTQTPELTGTVNTPQLFEWRALGYGIQIPEGWEYHVEADPATAMKNNFMMRNWFHNDEVSVTFRSYREMDVQQFIRQQIAHAKYSKELDLVIDGIPLKSYYSGSKEFGNIDFSFEAENKHHWVTFSGVSKNTLPLLQELMATIKIKNDLVERVNVTPSGLSNQLTLNELSPISIDQPLNPNGMLLDGECFDCELAQLDIVVKLPGSEADYLFSMGNLKGKIENGIIEAVPENETDKRLLIYSLNGALNSLGISKKTQTASNEQQILNFKRGWSIYKNTEFIHGSIEHINGLEWCVCITRNDNQFLTMSTCYVGDYEILISAPFSSKEEALDGVAYLNNVYYKPLLQ